MIRHPRPLTPPVSPDRAHVLPRHRTAPAILVRAVLCLAVLAAAPAAGGDPADKSAVTDGSAVLNVGRLHVNVTNWGLIGSHYSFASSFSHAPSAQWPGGTGDEYLFGAGLWVGARPSHGGVAVSCGEPFREFTPAGGVRDVMYEARSRTVVRPDNGRAEAGVPGDIEGGDDDGDGLVDEDWPDGRDQDGDGLVDEDFAQRGAQMFSCIMRDDTPLSRQRNPDHRPLGLRVRQEACAWDEPGNEDIVGLTYVITNVSNEPLEDVYVGMFVDCDIARHNDQNGGMDDLAGIFTGLVRQPEEYWEDFAYGWMRDAASEEALPGWFGVGIDGTGFGDKHAVRPEHFDPHSLRIINLESATGYLGLPFQDPELYDLLADRGRDPDPPTHQFGNYALLLSVGPYARIDPGQHCTVHVVFTVATGFDALQLQMRRANDAMDGRWYDGDGRYSSGGGGAETFVCAEDLHPVWDSPENPLYRHFIGFWDDSCRPPGPFGRRWTPDDLPFYDDIRKHCVWVNMDNCDECRRYHGVVCDGRNHAGANCYSSSGRSRGACTSWLGREVHLPWASATSLPPSPWVRAVARDRAVEIYWDDRSEHQPDELTGELDFESYRVWQAANWTRPPGTSEDTGPPDHAWSLKADFDRVNFQPGEPDEPRIPFGLNTGFGRIAYRPACLDDPRFAGLAEAMTDVVLADVEGRWEARPRLRHPGGEPVAGLEPLLPWEDHPAVLDTFFAVTERPAEVGVPKRAVRYYRYRDEDVHNGFVYFYAVTATDHVIGEDGESPVAPGSGRLPSGAFVAATPRVEAADHRREVPPVYVYPNPATVESLAEFQALEPSPDDPSGVRVAFANLPRCRCTIRVFTLAGDLVQTIEHDGAGGNGQAYWNLVSRNGQEVTSGIYLFVVEPHAAGFERAVGKFVVIR